MQNKSHNVRLSVTLSKAATTLNTIVRNGVWNLAEEPMKPVGVPIPGNITICFCFPLSIVNNNNKLERKMRINNAIKLRAAVLIISVFVFLRQIITACLNELYFLNWNEKSGRVFCGLKPSDKFNLEWELLTLQCDDNINLFVIPSIYEIRIHYWHEWMWL